MNLNEFKTLLEANRDKEFRLQLPDETTVPISFHITEVALVHKTFIDCGGTMRERKTCQLQAWVGPDEDHRIASGKMADILNKASSFLGDDDLPLEIEYEVSTISQYPVVDAQVSDDAVTLQLSTRHTECLAPELCIPAGLSIPLSSCGCGPTGCC
jgi:hypothetical protein